MRDLKFRAWLKGQMAYSSSVFEMMFEDGHYFYHGGESDKPNIEDVPIMQYTGLKDCNDVEIYEGDIVDCRHGYKGDIVYDDHHEAGGRFYPNFECDTCMEKERWYYYEVIGNIYENHELLEEPDVQE